MNVKDFYKQAREERAEEEHKEELRVAVVRAERTKFGYPKPPNYSTSFAKKLKERR
jgi:hypothetical protein